jgi:hypothetical protein
MQLQAQRNTKGRREVLLGHRHQDHDRDHVACLPFLFHLNFIRIRSAWTLFWRSFVGPYFAQNEKSAFTTQHVSDPSTSYPFTDVQLCRVAKRLQRIRFYRGLLANSWEIHVIYWAYALLIANSFSWFYDVFCFCSALFDAVQGPAISQNLQKCLGIASPPAVHEKSTWIHGVVALWSTTLRFHMENEHTHS